MVSSVIIGSQPIIKQAGVMELSCHHPQTLLNCGPGHTQLSDMITVWGGERGVFTAEVTGQNG